MRKSFMKKLFATLAVATLATVGAGVALTDSVVDDTNEVSAATSFVTDWTITNPSAITENNGTITVVTGEDAAVYDGAAIVSNATYTNFQLEYDIKVNTTGGWAPIAMFGMHKDSTMYYHSYKFVNVNIWDAIAAIQNGQNDATLANGGDSGQGAFSPWGSAGETVKVVTSGEKVSIKLVVQSGTVTLTMTQGNNVFTRELWSGDDLDTSLLTGRVGIPATISSNFTIEKLSITDLDKAQAVPTPPATTVNGTLLNNCDGTEDYWAWTNGTEARVTDIKSQGDASFKFNLQAGLCFTLKLVDYSAGAALLTEEQLFSYDGLYLEIYNPGAPVDLYLYNTLGASLQTGWNQVSIPKAMIQAQLDESKADRENNPTGALQFEAGDFFFAVYAETELYIDNVMGINPASVEPETPVTPPSASGDVLQGFETSAIRVANLVESVSVSTSNVTEGSYSNAVTLQADNTQSTWFEVYITLDKTDFTGYDKVAFDFYSRDGRFAMYYGDAEHTEYEGQNGTWYLDITTFKSLVADNVFSFVGIAGGDTDVVYFDNLRGIKSSGGETPDTPDTPAGQGTTAYTKFDNVLDSNWIITGGSRVSVSNGALIYANNTVTNDGIYTTGKYTNFIFEYDITPTLINQPEADPKAGWIPVIMFGVDGNANIGGSNYFIYMNQYGAIVGLNKSGAPLFTAELVSVHTAMVNETTHVKIEAQDGTVTAYFSRNGLTASFVIGTGLNTTGRIGIPVSSETGMVIDNLVIINSEEYANYQVNKIILPNSAPQANANQTLGGNLLDDIKQRAAAQGIDITNKEFNFRSKTNDFFLNPTTGIWEFETGRYNKAYVLEYVITVTDFVLDGWIYPLGTKGVYTIEGSITVDVINGVAPGDGEGGGEGDISEHPEVVGDNIVNHIQGKVRDISFIIDTKSYDILEITYKTENVKIAAYTTETVEEGTKITFKGDFVGLLNESDHEFIVKTLKGEASVIISVKNVKAPQCTDSSIEMSKNYETDAVFIVDTFGLDIISIIRAGESSALNNDAYTYVDGKLTIKKEYLATLDANEDPYRFTIYTEVGSVAVYVKIIVVELPFIEEDTAEFILGSDSDVEFEVDTYGAPIIQIVRVGADKALGDNAYSFNVEDMALTFKNAYLIELGAGEYNFQVYTAGGNVVLKITILPGSGPSFTNNKKSATFGESVAVSFTVDTKGKDIIAIQRMGATYGLGENAYTYSNGTLTIAGEYVALLPLGENEFKLETADGIAKFYIYVEDKTDTPENPDNPENPEEPDDGDYEGGDYEGDVEDNPFEEDITNPDIGEIPDGPADDENDGSGSYEDVFDGSVKPSEDSYNKYLEGLENGGKVSGGCNGSLSMVAGLPVVGIIAWLIRKKKED